MYFIILVVYLLNWKRILNIISSIYFFIFRIDEKYILKKWYYEKNGWYWKYLWYMKGKFKFVKYFDVDFFEILCKYGGFV